MAAARVHTIQ